MRVRLFATLLGLLIAAAPVIGMLCELDCDPPPAASSSCHTSSAAHDGASLRGTPHGCDAAHITGSPALLKSATARDLGAPPVTTAAPIPASVLRAELRPATAAAMHGSPGLSSPTSSRRTTVLRI